MPKQSTVAEAAGSERVFEKVEWPGLRRTNQVNRTTDKQSSDVLPRKKTTLTRPQYNCQLTASTSAVYVTVKEELLNENCRGIEGTFFYFELLSRRSV